MKVRKNEGMKERKPERLGSLIRESFFKKITKEGKTQWEHESKEEREDERMKGCKYVRIQA